MIAATELLPRNPHLYEINTRIWLNELSRRMGRGVTLGRVPREIWDGLKDLGMDLVWLMGVWQPSPESRDIAAALPDLRAQYRAALSDLNDGDIVGSPYAVAGYDLNPLLGGEDDLFKVRDALHEAGLGLILDFVPNHTARDHQWVAAHPDRYVFSDFPSFFGPGEGFPVRCGDGRERWVAHGRDPYFPPWTDTAQLNAFSSETRKAVTAELLQVAQWCDGLRCDMSMLLLNGIFTRTWGEWLKATAQPVPEAEFWAEVLSPLRRRFPEFILIAEAYWGCGEEMLNLGFGYTYDKEGYDRLRSGDSEGFNRLLSDEGSRSATMLRFLENHDEERMATAFAGEAWRSAAVIHAASPGMRLFHHGQLEGKTVRVPVQLGRGPEEQGDRSVADFYRRLLRFVADPLLKEGEGIVLDVTPAWEGDAGCRSLSAFGYRFGLRRAIVVVNHGTSTASGYVRFPQQFWPERDRFLLVDKLDAVDAAYARERKDMEAGGLYVRLGPRASHLFLTRSDDERA